MSRPIWQRFESVLADPITRYLAAKRSMGCRFNTEDRALRLLDRYLTEQRPHIRDASLNVGPLRWGRD